MKKITSLAAFAVAISLLAASCQHGTGATRGGNPEQSLVAGRIVDPSGAVIAEAYVYAYRESNTHFFGPPNHISPPSEPDGTYALSLPPGSYFLLARKRRSGDFQGPLNKDDYFSPPAGLTRVGAGTTKVDLVIQSLEGQQFYRPEKLAAKTTTVITGQITDSAGKPVFAAYAFAYRDRFRKQAPPDFASTGSGPEGKYFIYLEEGGTYVVGARMNAKEPPADGEPLGFFGQDRTKTVTVATGTTIDGINIVLTPFSGSPEVKPTAIPLQY